MSSLMVLEGSICLYANDDLKMEYREWAKCGTSEVVLTQLGCPEMASTRHLMPFEYGRNRFVGHEGRKQGRNSNICSRH